MKVRKPAISPDQHPEIEAHQPEADRVEAPQDQADQRLAADIAGDGPVDLAREVAHRRPVPRRHPAVDGRDHSVPIHQDVERDHGGHDQQRRDRDQCLAARPERFEEGQEPGPRLGREGADRGLQLAQDVGAADAFEQTPGAVGDDRLEPRHHPGQGVDERHDLVGGERDQDQQRYDQRDDEQCQDQQARREPPESEPLQPVGQRVEQVDDESEGDDSGQPDHSPCAHDDASPAAHLATRQSGYAACADQDAAPSTRAARGKPLERGQY
jgi:hypothetical protein